MEKYPVGSVEIVNFIREKNKQNVEFNLNDIRTGWLSFDR